jgi:hypothetical protein
MKVSPMTPNGFGAMFAVSICQVTGMRRWFCESPMGEFSPWSFRFAPFELDEKGGDIGRANSTDPPSLAD